MDAEQEGVAEGGGDPETGGNGRAARLKEDPQNPQWRVPRFFFVFWSVRSFPPEAILQN